MFRAIKKIRDEIPDIKVIYSIHMNPGVQEAASTISITAIGFLSLNGLDVLDFCNYLGKSYLILSYSDGHSRRSTKYR